MARLCLTDRQWSLIEPLCLGNTAHGRNEVELLARQRVKLINAMRGHMAEFGVVVPSGTQNLNRLMERIGDPDAPLPASVRAVLNILTDQMVALSKELGAMEAQMRKRCRENADVARLITIPGVGVITACAVLAGVPDIHAFRSGRGFAAWLGLVPRQTSSGGKPCLGRVTKMGDPTIRRLLVVGATSAIRWAKQKDGYDESWLGKMLARKPVKVAAVALASKNARIIWAPLTRQQSYRPA
jgi:transposase